MALLLHDGFENYTITNTGTGLTANGYLLLSQVWTYVGTIARLVPGAYGGLALGGLYNSTILYRGLSASASSVTVGFRLYSGGAALSQNSSTMRLLSGGSAGTTQIMLNTLTTGALQITRGPTINTNVLGTSSTGIIANNNYYYIEVSVLRSATVGTLSVKVNGTTVINLTGLNTGSADFDTLGLQGVANSNSSNAFEYDDVYVIDSLTPLGEVRIEPLYPDANDSVSWSPVNGERRLYGDSSASWSAGSFSGFTCASFIPTAGNWLFAIVNREVSSIPAVPAGWTLLSSALDTVQGFNSGLIYYRKIDDDFINGLTTNSSSASAVGPILLSSTGSFNGLQFLVEVPYDGIDPFLAAVSSATTQYSTTSGGGGISIPATSTATEDLMIFTLVGLRGSSLVQPVLNGGYDSTYQATGANSRLFTFGMKDLNAGASFTPTVTWGGTSTAYSMAHLVLPRKYIVNYMAVNDHRMDGDVAYNYTTSTSDSDQFTLSDPSADPTTIHFVVPKVVARKDDAASRTITPNIVSGGVSGGSPVTTALTAAYALQQGAVYATDPNTGAAWTYSAITSLKLKYTAGT